MTSAQERPAGRMAGRARPAGALRAGARRGTRLPVLDPSMIRQALDRSDRERLADVAAEFGVNLSTLSRWRAARRLAADRGRVWPSDDDVAQWQARQEERRAARAVRARWIVRRAHVGGPLTVDSTGTRRRLQALTAIGWRYGDVAAEVGMHLSYVGRLATSTTPVLHDTAAAIAAVYDRLCMTPGPSARCRALAANRGWPPPLAWDDHRIDDRAARPSRGARRAPVLDEIAVARAMHGDRVRLRPAERAEATRRLTAAGLTAGEIAARLDITQRSVVRQRAPRPDTRRTA